MIAGRTAIYARVSSEAQARENTIASQLASLREHVAADSLMLEPVIVMSTKASAALSLYARRSSDFVMRPLAARSSACMSTLLIAWLGATPIKRCSILLGRSADIAERDIALIQPGQKVDVRPRAYPDRSFKGQVALIYPHLNMETRTARVRIELPNPDGLLRGDMYAEVEIAAGGNEKVLTAPESAVIDTGKRQVATVDKGEGRFEPREVKIGRRGEGFVEIKSGVSENERVVTAANFLIDAESNLKAALRALDQAEAGK